MRFSAPLFLVLLVSLPLLAWMGWPVKGPSRRRESASLVLRLLIVLFLVLALAGMELVRGGNELVVVFLVDVSDSMPRPAVGKEIAYVREALRGMGPNDQAAVILFGSDALVERPMLASRELAEVSSVPITTQTDLAKAIQLGLALFPNGPARRMVILSDGIQTSGNAEAAARLAASSGVQLFTVPFVTQPGAEALVSSLDAPAHLRPGEQFALTVGIEASTSMEAQLRVLAGDKVIVDQRRMLRRGQQAFSIPLTAGDPGFLDYQVQLLPAQDSAYQNNRLDAFTQVDGPPRILVVASQAAGQLDESASLQNALRAAGFNLEVIPPARLPSSLPALAPYSSVVLVDIPASALDVNQMTAVQNYVRELGGGLVVIGGPASYGVGGYYDTPLEQALPVDMQIKDQKRRPSLAIVFIIDHSGSMGETSGGEMKLELAKEAAARSARLLFPNDRVGVLAFDDTASWVVPITPLSDPDTVTRSIGTIGVGGGTDILGAVQAMAKVLPGDPAKVKHVILLTDGGADPAGIPELVQQLNAEDGITFSTVGVGQDAAPFLKDLAARGGGRYHFTTNAGSIPAIFTEETTLAMRAYLVENRFTPAQVSASPVMSGIASVPPLYGYVATSPKPLAQVILESDQHDPVLAAWQYGLGRSVAFTSDATAHWGVDWVRWQGYPNFWAQVVCSTMGEALGVRLSMSVQQDQRHSTLTVDALGQAGEFLNGYDLRANIVSPTGSTQAVSLRQIAPGRYQASFDAAEQGIYVMRFTGSDAEGAGFAQTAGWNVSYSPEYRVLQPNPDLLLRLAALTGGKVPSANPAAAFDHSLSGTRATRPIAPWLIILAALLLPFDVAARRLVLARMDLLRVREALALRLRRPRPAGGPAAERSPRMEALLRSKERLYRAEPTAEPAARRDHEAPPSEAAPAATASEPTPHEDSSQPQPDREQALTQALLRRKEQLRKRNQ